MTRSSRPGHQKWVADWYLFQRKPTIITHIYGLHERKRDDEAHWLRNGYEWVTATIPGLGPPSFYSFLKRVDQPFGPFPVRQATRASRSGNADGTGYPALTTPLRNTRRLREGTRAWGGRRG